jgi:hypothetical protein
MRHVLWAASAGLCLALGAGAAGAGDATGTIVVAQAEPRIHREPNGAARVTFPDGCVVTYNRQGRRSGSQGCLPSQVERADVAIQEAVNDEGGGGLTMRRLANGSAEVTFDDGCVVTYNREGRRGGSRGCVPRQVERADAHVQRHWND